MPGSMYARIARLCVELEQPQTIDRLTRNIVAARDTFGYELHVFGCRGRRNLVQSVQVGVTNLSKEWRDRYDKQRLFLVDPYLRKAAIMRGAIRLSDVTISDAKEREFRDAIEVQGMKHGMLCTSIADLLFIGVLSFGGLRAVPEDAWPEMKDYLELYTGAATRAATRYLKNPSKTLRQVEVQLTDNERIALELSAQGKTVEEVAEEMRANKRTVRYYLEQAAEKLNVRNTREAVTEALALGLIRKRHFDGASFSDSVEES